MKLAIAALLAGIFFISMPGCSKDEDISSERVRVRMPIERPVRNASPEEILKSTANEPSAEKKSSAALSSEKESSFDKPDTMTAGDTGKVYKTESGDTLSGIASKIGIYGSTLQWPVLYRHNREILSQIAGKEFSPDMKLPENLPLKLITAVEFDKNLTGRQGKYEVINVVSSTDMEKITPFALALADNSFLVYLTRAEIEGKEWLRLRVGFFNSREEAKKASERIKSVIDISDTWVTTSGEMEFREFAGY